MTEIWKDIEDYEGLYQISNYGRVKSLDYNHTGRVKELAPRANRGGYLYINLYNKGIRKTHVIHRLVARAFIDNPNDYPVVNHKDCNKQNNHASNLEWCTISQNTKHAYDNGLINTRDIIIKASKANKKPVRCITTSKEFESAKEAEYIYGVSHSNIAACCKGKRKSAGKLNGEKLVWEYINDDKTA